MPCMPPDTLGEVIDPHLELEAGTWKGGDKGFTCIHCERHFVGSQSRHICSAKKGKALLFAERYPSKRGQRCRRPAVVYKTHLKEELQAAPCLRARQVCTTILLVSLRSVNVGALLHGKLL